MARTVDPQRHEQRRLQIIDAALTCFAARGYDGTSTAALCREAGIGSGTFFHYFPTKRSLLLAILDLGAADTRAWFAGRPAGEDPLGTVRAYLVHATDEFADPRTVGLVRALGAVVGDAEVDAAGRRDADAVREGLLPAVARARQLGVVRADRDPEDLVTWLMVLLDGFVSQLAGSDTFTVEAQRAMLLESAELLLSGPRR